MKKFFVGTIYHVFNKSIANYPIFKDLNNSERFIQALDYYNKALVQINLGNFLRKNKNYSPELLTTSGDRLVKILAYCIMPDHYHILIKILKENCLSKYINDVENSYSRFFNLKFKRKGPLWQSSFKFVRIKSNEQLLHVSRYIHLNPTTANLVDKPEDWIFSSYKYYLNNDILKNYLTEISIKEANSYKKFCEDNIDYQRKLKLIKKLILE
jgi:putative transposase